ncbi:MAG: S-layer protein [Methanoregula sp.]|nr:S-layer protein [Methanoregula sp.]
MLGDMQGGDNRKATFLMKINSDADSGTYMLPLTINYTYLYQAEQFGFDSIQYFYKQVNETLEIPIKIQSVVSIDVQSVTPEHLNVGTEGYLTMKIKNTGSEDGTKAIVKILRNSNSPIVPTDSSIYIGDFLSGSIVECRYKVSVSKDAVPQVYPVSIEVVYKNKEGDFMTSRNDTVGVPVGGKVVFEVISNSAEINPGNKKIINVEYKNTGETTIYSTQARIIAVDPFTSNDDIAFLGDLRPGESAIASYEVNVDRSATIKEYGLDSELRYRDALDNTYISDTMKVKIIVRSPVGISAVFSNPVYLSIIVTGIIGCAYLAYHYRKK